MRTVWVLIAALRVLLFACGFAVLVIGMAIAEPTTDVNLALASLLAVAIVGVPALYIHRYCSEWYEAERVRIIRANRRVKPNYTN